MPSAPSSRSPDPPSNTDNYLKYLDMLQVKQNESTINNVDETHPNLENDHEDDFLGDGSAPFFLGSDDEELLSGAGAEPDPLFSGMFSGIPQVSTKGFCRSSSSGSANSIAVDKSLREKYSCYVDSRHGTAPIDAQYVAQVKLLDLLKNTPIYLFDKIWDWAGQPVANGVNFLDKAQKRKAVHKPHDEV